MVAFAYLCRTKIAWEQYTKKQIRWKQRQGRFFQFRIIAYDHDFDLVFFFFAFRAYFYHFILFDTFLVSYLVYLTILSSSTYFIWHNIHPSLYNVLIIETKNQLAKKKHCLNFHRELRFHLSPLISRFSAVDHPDSPTHRLNRKWCRYRLRKKKLLSVL